MTREEREIWDDLDDDERREAYAALIAECQNLRRALRADAAERVWQDQQYDAMKARVAAGTDDDGEALRVYDKGLLHG